MACSSHVSSPSGQEKARTLSESPPRTSAIASLVSLASQANEVTFCPPGNGPPSLFNIQRCQLGALLHIELPSTLLQKLRAARAHQQVTSSSQVATNSCHVCRAAAKKSVTSQGAICKLGPLRHSPPVSMTAGRAPSIISPSCCLLAEALRRTDNACKHILDSLAACALGYRRNEPGMPAATLLSRHCRRPDLKPGSGSPCPFTASLSLVDKRVHLHCLYWYCTFMMLGG